MNRFYIGYDSDRGTTHSVNQDSIFIKSFSGNDQRILVAGLFDGMGGLSEGERVSGAAAQTFSAWANSNKELLLAWDHSKIIQSLNSEFDSLNEKIRAYGKRISVETGTTAALLIIGWKGFLCCNVGDSRIYHIGKSRSTQITEDHSLVADLVRARLLDEKQARSHPQKSVLTQAVGVLEKITPSYRLGSYDTNDIFVLCCDGFYHELSDAELQELYRVDNEQQKITERLKALRDLVISRGETDNITSILIKATSEG